MVAIPKDLLSFYILASTGHSQLDCLFKSEKWARGGEQNLRDSEQVGFWMIFLGKADHLTLVYQSIQDWAIYRE